MQFAGKKNVSVGIRCTCNDLHTNCVFLSYLKEPHICPIRTNAADVCQAKSSSNCSTSGDW